jgi:hypothetical protein
MVVDFTPRLVAATVDVRVHALKLLQTVRDFNLLSCVRIYSSDLRVYREPDPSERSLAPRLPHPSVGLKKMEGHKDSGLTVSRFRRYDHTEVLQPENRDYTSITLGAKYKWKIVARVRWWIGKAT